jgi:curli biogenesis system outer membrane secretion channel CsgG
MLFLGCGGITTNVTTSSKNANDITKYNGPKARVAVASFKCKAAKCNGSIGSGIADMLTTELVKTGKFIVLERGEGLNAIEREYNLNTQLNRPSRNLEGADVLIVGAITAFEPKASGTGIGGIVVPKGIPFVGGIKLGKNEAYIAVDLRLIDLRTGRIIAATTVEGKTSDWKIGGMGGGVTSFGIVGGGLSTYKNTPMEKAVRVMIAKAVKSIEKLLPENYYRYENKENVSAENHTVSNTSQTETPKKVVFKEDFEKYGTGQTIPFGPWEGDKFSIATEVQSNGQIGKVLHAAGDWKRICVKNLKVKDMILDVDATCDLPTIFFRVTNKKPFTGYKLRCGEEKILYKVAGNSKMEIAKSSVRLPAKRWHKIRIITKGSNIRILIDGIEIINIKDNDKYLNNAGTICVGTEWGRASIDNIVIYQ